MGRRNGRGAFAVIVVTVSLLAACAGSGGSARRPVLPYLSHAGRYITYPSGAVAIFHGVNVVNKIAPYYPGAFGFSDDDAAFLAANGFNAVRLGIIDTAVEPSPGTYDDAYLANIDQTVRILAKHGIYSLIDMHQDQFNETFGGEGFPSWMVQDNGLPVTKYVFPLGYELSPALNAVYDNFWNDAPGPGGIGLQERFVAAWRHVAARFANEPYVLGYDLYNEPWPGSLWTTCISHTGCPAFDAKLGALESKVDTAIRSVDNNHLVFYEPNIFFDFGVPTNLPVIKDANAGMDFHDYCETHIDNQWGGCDAAAKLVLSNAADRSSNTGDALLASEWGTADDPVTSITYETDFDQASMSWLEWAYCGCGDPTGTIPPSSEALVYDPSKPPQGANLNSAMQLALARPYPTSIAGTPVSYAFDTTTKVFTFSYDTFFPDRLGAHGAGATTRIAVPPVQYPNGYKVSVTGGRVTSAPGAAAVTIAAVGGATRVSLAVRPA